MNKRDFIKAFVGRMGQQQDITVHDIGIDYHPKHDIEYFHALLVHRDYKLAKFLSVQFDDKLTLDELVSVIKEIDWNSSAYSATKRQDHV